MLLDLTPLAPGSLRFVPPETPPEAPPRLAYRLAPGRTRPATSLKVPANPVALVALAGRHHLTYDALAECWEHGASLALNRGARVLALLRTAAPRSSRTRARACHRLLANPDHARRLVEGLVKAKIANQAASLRLAQLHRPHPQVEACRRNLRILLRSWRRGRDIATLRGLEGRAAAEYFRAWDGLLARPGFRRQARARRDPVNLLLDIAYARLVHALSLRLLAAGCDLAVGALHVSDGDRPTLALDLVEPLRPALADRFVLKLLRTPAHRKWLVEDQDGFSLTRDGWRQVNQRWEHYAHGQTAPEAIDHPTTHFEKLLDQTVAAFAAWLESNQDPVWPRLR